MNSAVSCASMSRRPWPAKGCGSAFASIWNRPSAVVKVGPPRIDAVRGALGSEDIREGPALADVLPLALARGEVDVPLPQHVQVQALERRHEVERRADPEVFGHLAHLDEAHQIVGA